MKLCEKCGINYIDDNEQYCSLCKEEPVICSLKKFKEFIIYKYMIKNNIEIKVIKK